MTLRLALCVGALLATCVRVCTGIATTTAATTATTTDPYPDCTAYTYYLGDGGCDGGDYNTRACGWDGGDCCNSTCVGTCSSYYFDCRDPAAPDAYPDCRASSISFVGDGDCDGGLYNTRGCAWDGGDCCNSTCAPASYSCSDDFDCRDTDIYDSDEYYPDCTASVKGWLGDGACDGGDYNNAECGWDGGDCCETTCPDSNCGSTDCQDPDAPAPVLFPNCDEALSYLGDGYCNGGDYNTRDCGWDGGDCCASTCVSDTYTCGTYDCRDTTASDGYPDCRASSISFLGDGDCEDRKSVV